MKKIILSVAAVFAFGFANAQDIKYGVKAGLNVSTITGDVDNTSSLIGAHVGGFVEIKLNDKFAIQPELLFSMQGAKSEYNEADGLDIYKVEETMKLNYLNLPIMAKYYATEKFSIEAGPQVGFLMSAKDEVTVEGLGSQEVDFKDYLKSVDFGVNFGLGYNFTENVVAGVRYNLGLADISNIDGFDGKFNNSVFSVSVGYRF